MADSTETVTLRLPSGEEVDAVVPAGMEHDQISALMQKKHPDYFPPPEFHAAKPNIPELAPNPPAAPAPSTSTPALGRFWEGAKAGVGGETALNTSVDPEHPISTNAMIPGAGVYRDIKGGNYAGALGRIAGPAAELAPFAFGGRSKPVYERPVPEVSPPNTAPKFMAHP